MPAPNRDTWRPVRDMSKGRQASVEVDRHLERLTFEGFGPAQIYRDLEQKGWFGGDRLSLRTVQRMVHHLRPADPSGPWSMAEAEDPEEARLVLRVLAAVFESTAGRVWLTKDLVVQIVRVQEAVPDIPPLWAYNIAQAYQVCAIQGRDSRHLDFALGARPWESAERADWFARLLDRPLPAQSHSIHSDSLMALLTLMSYRGSLEDMRERFPDYSRDPVPPPRLPVGLQTDGIAAESRRGLKPKATTSHSDLLPGSMFVPE
jgi:hypothetical protein